MVVLLVFLITKRIIKGKGPWRLRESQQSTHGCSLITWYQMPPTMVPSLLLTFCDNQHPKSTLSVNSKCRALMGTGPEDHHNRVLLLQPSELKSPYRTEDELPITEGAAHLHRQL